MGFVVLFERIDDVLSASFATTARPTGTAHASEQIAERKERIAAAATTEAAEQATVFEF